MKDQLLKSSSREGDLLNELEQRRTETMRLREYIRQLQGGDIHHQQRDSETMTSATSEMTSFECTMPSCVDRKRALIEENKALLEKVSWCAMWHLAGKAVCVCFCAMFCLASER